MSTRRVWVVSEGGEANEWLEGIYANEAAARAHVAAREAQWQLEELGHKPQMMCYWVPLQEAYDGNA